LSFRTFLNVAFGVGYSFFDRIISNKADNVREALSSNHSCGGKAVSITNSVIGFVTLGIQHAGRMRHTVICGLSGCNSISPHYLINGNI
jgi:hypothetical protein